MGLGLALTEDAQFDKRTVRTEVRAYSRARYCDSSKVTATSELAERPIVPTSSIAAIKLFAM